MPPTLLQTSFADNKPRNSFSSFKSQYQRLRRSSAVLLGSQKSMDRRLRGPRPPTNGNLSSGGRLLLCAAHLEWKASIKAVSRHETRAPRSRLVRAALQTERMRPLLILLAADLFVGCAGHQQQRRPSQ